MTKEDLLEHAEAFLYARDLLEERTHNEWDDLTEIEGETRKAMTAALGAVGKAYQEMARLRQDGTGVSRHPRLPRKRDLLLSLAPIGPTGKASK